MLETTLGDNDIWNCPSQIFNFDETGMPLDPGTVRPVVDPGGGTGGKCTFCTIAPCNPPDIFIVHFS